MDFTADMLADLRVMLKKANVDDAQIARGVRLTEKGMQKISDRYGIDLDTAHKLLAALVAEPLTEDVDRYTYEKDVMGNVTIRDSEAGTERFLRGDAAFTIIKNLEAHPRDRQKILAACFSNTLNESTSTPTIVSNQGTFNFPYKGMLATAEFGLDADGIFLVNVASLRDNSENELEITPQMRTELNAIAMKWVDKV